MSTPTVQRLVALEYEFVCAQAALADLAESVQAVSAGLPAGAAGHARRQLAEMGNALAGMRDGLVGLLDTLDAPITALVRRHERGR